MPVNIDCKYNTIPLNQRPQSRGHVIPWACSIVFGGIRLVEHTAQAALQLAHAPPTDTQPHMHECMGGDAAVCWCDDGDYCVYIQGHKTLPRRQLPFGGDRLGDEGYIDADSGTATCPSNVLSASSPSTARLSNNIGGRGSWPNLSSSNPTTSGVITMVSRRSRS